MVAQTATRHLATHPEAIRNASSVHANGEESHKIGLIETCLDSFVGNGLSGKPLLSHDVAESLSTEDQMALTRRYCAPTHSPIPIVLKHGLGAHVWDIDGNQYIDFLSGFSVVNQGHGHPEIVKALQEQSQKLSLCTSALQNETYPFLCKRICELLKFDMVASMSSGSEAVDLCFKIARKWGHNVKRIPSDRVKILTVTGNYHGKSLGPLSGSSNDFIRSGFGPFIPNIGPDVAGSPVRFNQIDDVEKTFEIAGAEIAAVVIECVQGAGGCIPAEKEYMKALRKLCREYEVLLVADEIQTGWGRTGTLMAYEYYEIIPDMVILGKALTGGLYPMSMVLGSKEIMTQLKTGEHSSTFAANPLASAVALAAINVTLNEDLAGRAQRLGGQLMSRLSSIKVAQARTWVTGRGFLCAFHIEESPDGRITAARLSKLVRRRGLIAVSAANRVRIAPPLVIQEKDLWKGVEILENALHDLEKIEDS